MTPRSPVKASHRQHPRELGAGELFGSIKREEFVVRHDVTPRNDDGSLKVRKTLEYSRPTVGAALPDNFGCMKGFDERYHICDSSRFPSFFAQRQRTLLPRSAPTPLTPRISRRSSANETTGWCCHLWRRAMAFLTVTAPEPRTWSTADVEGPFTSGAASFCAAAAIFFSAASKRLRSVAR